MAWARLDDQWWCHPKVMGLTLAASGLWARALSWSCSEVGRRHEGVVPVSFVRMVAGEDTDTLAAELVAAGLWVEVDGGWAIHDWSEYQELSLSERRAAAGRKGAHKRWQTDGKRMANGWQTDSKHGKDDSAETAQQQAIPLDPEGDGADGKPMANRWQTDGKPIATPIAGSHTHTHTHTHTQPLESDLLPSVVDHSRRRQRDEVWDALVELFGEPATDSNRKLRGKVVASLKRAGATYDEILRRAQSWPLHFESATLTETALEKHWDRLGQPPMRASPRQARQVLAELDRAQRRRLIGEAMGGSA